MPENLKIKEKWKMELYFDYNTLSVRTAQSTIKSKTFYYRVKGFAGEQPFSLEGTEDWTPP